MIQVPVWPLPYWGTACLLCLVYLPMGWVAEKCYDRTSCTSAGWDVLLCVFLVGTIVYTFVPGYYFSLSLRDVQWAYLEAK